MLGPSALLGVSVNTEAELAQVLSEGHSSYVGIGPVYDTATKKDLNTLLGTRGTARLLELLGESPVKAVVIGKLATTTFLCDASLQHCLRS